jgi:hypothetical protein
MKAFVGVTDNDWFAFLSRQPKMYGVNSLPKQSAIIMAGRGLGISLR